MPSPSLAIGFCWKRWQILLLSCSPLEWLGTAPSGSRAAVDGQQWRAVASSPQVAQLSGDRGSTAAPRQCLLRGPMSAGTGKASHASCQGVSPPGCQPPTPSGTCSAKPGTLLGLIGKSKVLEGTLTYLPDQFGLLFMNILCNQNHYSIQLFFVVFKFLGLS